MNTNRPPVVDCDELIERMMGNMELAERMLWKFLDTGVADCDLMESTIRFGDKESIASMAHRHKGAAETLAVRRIAENAAELEKRAFTHQTSDLLVLIDRIRSAHREVREAVRQGLTDLSCKSSSEPA